jgi:hypothetical protein
MRKLNNKNQKEEKNDVIPDNLELVCQKKFKIVQYVKILCLNLSYKISEIHYKTSD